MQYRFTSLWGSVAAAFCLLASCQIQAFAQAQPSGSSQAQGSSPAQASPEPAKEATTTNTADKGKKVWTNENLGDVNGPVSVVGNPKNGTKGRAGSTPADPQYIAKTRKELEKLQSELDDTNKKVAELKKFLAGESVSYSGYQYRKGYDREPVDAQIHDLEEKKKQTQGKIDALLEEARKKGIEPGQLR